MVPHLLYVASFATFLVTQHPLFPFERERALCDETKYWLEKRENPNPPTERKSKLFVYS